MKYGSLTLLVKKYERYCGKWWKGLYQCDCGVQKVIINSSVTSGRSKSCGCSRLGKKDFKARKHGKTNTYEYGIWAGIRGRCLVKTNSGYHRYGAIGITMCQRWQDDFLNFLEDMGPATKGMTIDRIDNSRGYSKENCRWATYKQQSQNKNVRKDSKTGVTGVTITDSGKYLAAIGVDGKDIKLGLFVNIEDAILSRKQAEKYYFEV